MKETTLVQPYNSKLLTLLHIPFNLFLLLKQRYLAKQLQIIMPKVYEATRHRLSVPDINDGQKDDHSIKRHDLLVHGAVFCLRNFLSHEECRDLIEQAERLGLEECGYSIRKNGRVAANSGGLSELFFDRLKPYLAPRFGIPGTMAPYKWYPSGVNPTFRICRYDRGGFFLPHHDGGFQKDKHCRSIQTLMIYLNEDFGGGATNFYNQLQRHYESPDQKNVIHSYRPRTGDALVFHSNITHDGGIISSGNKYILRSEIMYTAMDELTNHQNEKVAPDHDPNSELSWP